MLLFVNQIEQGSNHLHHVSIHLMLLFICVCRTDYSIVSEVSIHLMLLFIQQHLWLLLNIVQFQYISCYSLSVMAGTQGTFRTSFNTSHVTLYLWNVYQKWKLKLCLNTSHVTLYLASFSDITFPNVGFNTSHVTLYLFQYFTCKCLSGFNTSHVTLYHLFPEYLLSV